jgi:hypothetical protein
MVDLVDAGVEFVGMIFCKEGIGPGKPCGEFGLRVKDSCLQASDGDLLPGSQVGDHVFGGPVGSKALNSDFFFTFACQQLLPTVKAKSLAGSWAA